MSSGTAVGFPRKHSRFLRSSNLAVFAASLAAGFGLFAIDEPPRTIISFVLGAASLVALLLYPEFALALYVVIGDVKGDERVAAIFPGDLTLAVGAILVAGIALNLLRNKRVVQMPVSYFLYLALVGWMAASLTYTPVFEAGLEKFGRFLTVTGIVIVAPFFALGTPQTMKRFLAGFAIFAFAICAYSLTDLGGSERLATPSNNTIGLGHVACALILLVWFALMPKLPFLKRLLIYPVLAVPLVALIGSGSRGAVLALAVVMLVSLFFYRQLLPDIGCLLFLGFGAIPFVNIPHSSFEYLGTLFNSRNVDSLLNFRAELLSYGWNLLQQHPLIGVGIQGFRYHSLNAGLYNWPHNIFLETCCELGIPAGLIVFAIFGAAIRESFLQLKDARSPLITLSHVAAALLLVGIVNATNTGDINSDRSTWLFLSLIFIVRGLRAQSPAPSNPNSRATVGRPLPA
jgi:O-antigen ligase